jgi:serine/threonine-protein kinase/endoribonuclease IRE1
MLLVLLIASFFVLALAQTLSLRPQHPPAVSHALVEHSPPQHTRFPQPDTDVLDSLDLLDILLLASVDGNFHALNRTSGDILWSMSARASSSSKPSALAPLVRTEHVDYDPDLVDDSTPHEMYIIEPQSGDIYVLPNPSSPLQRFPFTMQELVDMSPFSFSSGDGDDDYDGRVFVGKKETSLLVVELETGKVKATLNSECPWDQFEEFRRDGREDDEVDLDELDGSKPQKPPTTDVYIGRTGESFPLIPHRHNRLSF